MNQLDSILDQMLKDAAMQDAERMARRVSHVPGSMVRSFRSGLARPSHGLSGEQLRERGLAWSGDGVKPEQTTRQQRRALVRKIGKRRQGAK
jgi:hypothetical protein